MVTVSPKHLSSVQLVLALANSPILRDITRWTLARPSCGFYDGDSVCPLWRDWLSEGLKFFPKKSALYDAAKPMISANIPKAEVLEVIQSCMTPQTRREEGLSALSFRKRR